MKKMLIKSLLMSFLLMLGSLYCVAQDTDIIFEGKVILITGTSSGLGRSIAKIAAKKKMKLILVDKNLGPSKEMERNILAKGGEAFAIKADLSKPYQRSKIIREALKKFGKIDILVNNAGYVYVAKIEEIDMKEAKDLFEVNFWAYLDLAKKVVPIMKENKGGYIINISSINGVITESRSPIGAYVASKHAVNGLFKVMAKEVKDYGVNVKIVVPGGFRSNICNNAIGPGKDMIKDLYEKIKNDPELLCDPEILAEEIFNKMGQKEVVIVPENAKKYFTNKVDING